MNLTYNQHDQSSSAMNEIFILFLYINFKYRIVEFPYNINKNFNIFCPTHKYINILYNIYK